MPYIKTDRRYDIVEEEMEGLMINASNLQNAGELNFAVTAMIIEYFENNGGRYQQINDIVGALEGAKLEFYRRKAASYEDEKIKENGDVYR